MVQCNTIARFVVLLLCLFGVVNGYKTGSLNSPVLDSSQEAVCVPVKYDRDSNSKVYIELGLESGPKDKEYTTLILHLTDIANFTNVPLVEQFQQQKLHDYLIKDGKFDLELSPDRNSINEDELYNGPISSKNKIHFDVKKSGFYCVYVDTNQDNDVAIPIIYRNSYGYLNYFEYLLYTRLMYAAAITFGLIVTLLFLLLKRVGNDFRNLNGLSLIPRATIFYVLAPYCGIFSLEFVADAILNHTAYRRGLIIVVPVVISWLEECLGIIIAYFVLLFSMGYGVLYALTSTGTLRELPKRSKFIANCYLFIHLFQAGVKTLLNFHSNSVAYSGFTYGDFQYLGHYKKMLYYFEASSTIILFVWLFLCLASSRQTKKVLDKFPPYPTTTDDSSVKNAEIKDAYVKTIAIIIIGPVMFGFLNLMFVIGYMYPKMRRLSNVKSDLEYILVVYDMEIENTPMLNKMIWNDFASFVTIICLIYYIWIKDNRELVIENDTEEQDGRFDIDSGDEN